MKKIVSLLLSASFILSMVACSSNENSISSKNDEKSTSEAAITENQKASEDASSELPLKGVTIGFSEMEANGTYRITEAEAAQSLADQYGATLVYADAQGDTAKQASDISDMIAQGCDYIIVVPREVNGLTSVCREAMDAGIPVLLNARSIEGKRGVDYFSCAQPNAVGEGETMAKYMIDKIGDSGNLVILEGTAGSASAIDRQTGIDNILANYPNIKVIAKQDGNFTLAEGQAVMENIIQAWKGKIDGIISHNDDMALGAVQALESAGIDPGTIPIVTVDGQKSALEAILDGKITSTLDCTPRRCLQENFDLIIKKQNGEEISDDYLDSLETNIGDIWDISNAKQVLDDNLGF